MLVKAGGGRDVARAGSASCLGEEVMRKLPCCDTLLKEKEKAVCLQFFSLRIGSGGGKQWEVHIQRYRLSIRDKDVFSGTQRRVTGKAVESQWRK